MEDIIPAISKIFTPFLRIPVNIYSDIIFLNYLYIVLELLMIFFPTEYNFVRDKINILFIYFSKMYTYLISHTRITHSLQDIDIKFP